MAFEFKNDTRGYRILDEQGIIAVHNATMDLRSLRTPAAQLITRP